MALTDKLTNIANAIRQKGGTTEKLTLDAMPTAISALSTGGGGGGVDIPDEAFVIKGVCRYWDYNGSWDKFITTYANKWSTNNIIDAQYMFSGSNLETIPFELNFDSDAVIKIEYMFTSCTKLKELPALNNLKVDGMTNIFYGCNRLKTIPENYADTWNWSYVEGQTSGYSCNMSNMFSYCYSLRSIPMNIIKKGNPYIYYSYSYFYNGFRECYVLDELNNLPIPYIKATWTSNAFASTFRKCNRLKNITFALLDGQPYVVNWKSQDIDLSSEIGYSDIKNRILDYNSGITADKEVVDDATYQALKNDADWFSCDYYYSRYNHDSAVATINTLPDTSTYLASAGGTNTIKFKGESGSATDGGAINTLTEAEIAVATAKGWTVSLV